MLDQLPQHTVAKRVDNYEHLDLLWGKDVDKLVFPHIFEFLKTYAEPAEGRQAEKGHDGGSSRPTYSDILSGGGTDGDCHGTKSFTNGTVADKPSRGSLYANAVIGNNGSSDDHDVGGSDSDMTMGGDKALIVKPGISFADAANATASASPPPGKTS
jgi:lysosomal acid lipase/cholesteryl ester hydrolase